MTQKSRSLISLLVLAGISTGAGLFAYYGIHKKQEKEKAEKEKNELLFPHTDKSKITNLSVTAKGQATVLSLDDSKKWKITSPVSTSADTDTVNSLVEKLVSLKRKSMVEENASDLAPYGLNQPRIKIIASSGDKGGDKKELIFHAGNENQFDNSFYAALGNSKNVLQVEGGFQYALEKSLFDLRNKQVIPFEESQLKGLEVKIDQITYTLQKVDDHWEITSPLSDRAESSTVDKIVNSLRNLKASQYVTDSASPEDFVKYQLNSPRAKVTAVLTNDTKITVLASQAEENSTKKYYARLEEMPFIAEISESIFKDLAVSIADLLDKSVVRFERDEVSKVTFQFGSESVTLEQKPNKNSDSDWKIVAPITSTARKGKMDSILWSLSSLKGIRLVDETKSNLEKYGLQAPTRKITLFDRSGKKLDTLLLGQETGNDMYVMGSLSGKVFEVEKSSVSSFPVTRADLEEPVASNEPKSAATPKNEPK